MSVKFSIAAMVVMLISILLLTIKVFSSDQAKEETPIGRFQLFQGTFIALDGKNNRADKEIGIFLLDTSTGKVKRYSTGLYENGKIYESWLPTED